jgi:hypothetical protein
MSIPSLYFIYSVGLIGGVVALLIFLVFFLTERYAVSARSQILGKAIMSMFNDFGDGATGPKCDDFRARRMGLAAELAADVRAEFRFAQRDEANEMVARRYILKQLRKIKDIRNVDIKNTLFTAVNLSFVRCAAEVEADEIMVSDAVIAHLEWDWKVMRGVRAMGWGKTKPGRSD